MSKIVVTWSIAYDYLMRVDDEFKNIILPDQIAKLNVWFVASDMKKSLWWTAANIAYSLGLLWLKDQTVMLATVGKDFIPDERISTYVDFSHILKIEDDFTACAYVITDPQEHQIIPFYPGAMKFADKQSLLDIDDVSYCIVAPNSKPAMMKFIQEAKEKHINCFFDPGQAMGLFNKEELISCCTSANYLICNEYEFDLLMKKTERNQDTLLTYFEKIIVSLGKQGVKLLDEGKEILIPWVLVDDAVDPTWCGDALRAWLLYGLVNDMSWEESLKMGVAAASYAVKFHGGMNHFFTRSDIKKLID